MSTRPKPFQAWALPSGVALPEGAELQYEAGGLRVRHPRATPPWIRRIVDALEEARRPLLERSAGDVLAVLGRVGGRFLDPSDPIREAALEALPPTSGLSPRMARAVLDGMASDWTPDRLESMVVADLGGSEVLDGFVADADGRRVRAVPPRLCVQVVSGSVPGVGVTGLLRSLVVKAPTLLKPGRGDIVLPVLFARALREEDAALADALAVVYWPGGSEALESAALERADAVTAYGEDETVRSLRDRTPPQARFAAYPHRISFAVVGREVLTEKAVHRAACDAAGAVAFFDQRGCVSPRVIYVETGGDVEPSAFAAALARALELLEERLPGGTLDPREASAVHQIRGTAELLASSGEGFQVHHGGSASWTVVYDPAPAFAPACVGRVVRVKPVSDILEAPSLVSPFRRSLQTVGLAGCGERRERLANALADVGVTRVAPLSAVPFPPAWWHHDGQGPLTALLRWVDLES